MSEMELLIDGKIYRGWTEVSVRRSLDYFADSFHLALTAEGVTRGQTIKLGSPCRVRIDGEVVITGHVDRIRPKYDGRSRKLAVAGRSKTADLVDCSLPPKDVGSGQRRGQTLLQLANSLCGRFNIKARAEVDDLVPVRITDLAPEQTAFEFLELQARTAGVRLVSDADGNLVITRASSERVGTALILGENIEAAEGEFSGRDRYSHYYLTGQRPNPADDDIESALHITGEAKDINVRYRPTTVIAEGVLDGSGMAKRRAEWQRNIMYGRSRQATYTVSGWHHNDGLWRPNTNVLIRDEWMGFTGKDGRGEWLMIGTVEYTSGARGKRTLLTVMPAAAYDLIPLPADDEGVW